MARVKGLIAVAGMLSVHSARDVCPRLTTLVLTLRWPACTSVLDVTGKYHDVDKPTTPLYAALPSAGAAWNVH